MPKMTVKLLRPLNNRQVGELVDYDRTEAERLAGYGSVEIVGEAEDPADSADSEAGAARATPKPKAAAPATKVNARKGTKGR